jgi:FkbM family methyltransferase
MEQKILIYVGGHLGYSIGGYVDQFDKIFVFEANPHMCNSIRSNFPALAPDGSPSKVQVIQAAVCDKHNETASFYISKNNGDSSSLFQANKDGFFYDLIEGTEIIQVPTINLYNFLQEKNITYIDTYVSDLQGYDFIVLKTLLPLIQSKRIKYIQCEVEKDDKPATYVNPVEENLNKEKNFYKLLSENYDKVAEGNGRLVEGYFHPIREEWPEMDILWKAKH